MFIFLPIEHTHKAIDKFMDKFSVETINKALTEGESNDVDVELPRLHLEGEYMMGDVSINSFMRFLSKLKYLCSFKN